MVGWVFILPRIDTDFDVSMYGTLSCQGTQQNFLYDFQGLDIWALGVTMYCFLFGKVSIH